MNRSEPRFATSARSRSYMNFVACSRSMVYPAKLSLLAALPRASPIETTLRRTSSCRFWSSVCMPSCAPVWIAEYICATLFSRIRLRIAGVPIMISCAATRPLPSLVFSSACEITARKDSESIARTISFSAAGNTSTIRSIVFAAQDRVRVLARRGPEGVRERQRVRPDLALVDEAFLRLVHELDRVLHGENVAVLVLVDVVDHRRQRRRLARAGRPGDEHEAARVLGDGGEDLRCVQLLEAQHLGRDRPHHGGGAALLHERVDAEPREPRHREREVALEVLLVSLALRVVHDVVDHRVH